MGFALPLDQVWLSGMVDYADAAVECGDTTHAPELFERLAPWHAQLPATGASALAPVSLLPWGTGHRPRELRRGGRPTSRSRRPSGALGAAFFAARTDQWWGAMLARRSRSGDAEAAAVRLTRAQDVARRRGYGIRGAARQPEALAAIGH